MEADVAMVGAGAQGPGGLGEESGLWGGHLFPQDQWLQPHLRQEQGEASGLEAGVLEAMVGEQPQVWEF